jgi:D-alanyl-lipoteichoic acid acyltransferase DltB (MBOAT superfamily)
MSPSDFWRRWHISLSTWLRDYLYIPLGGNRKSNGRTYFNLATVMFLGGLWHGASWNFVIWGLLHGAYLALHKLVSNRFPQLQIHPFFKTRSGKIISILITQYFVFLAWIPFRVEDSEAMWYSIQKFVIFDFKIDGIDEFVSTNIISIGLILLFLALHVIAFRKTNLIEYLSKLRLRYWTIVITSIMMAVVLFYNGDPESFIYFRF